MAAYTAAGGPALWRLDENPNRVIGRTIFLKQVEGLPGCTELPEGVIDGYDGCRYSVTLRTPLTTDLGEARTLRISARHRGYPVSAARRSLFPFAVNGELSSGEQFIALVKMSPPNNRWRGP